MAVTRRGTIGTVAHHVVGASGRRAPLVGLLVVALLVIFPAAKTKAAVDVVVSEVTGTDGTVYWVKNHLVRATSEQAADVQGSPSVTTANKYLVVWAGSVNAADYGGFDTPKQAAAKAATPPGPDFLAVIDAGPTSPTYGKVVNTAIVGPAVENEPHHMQYLYHKGDRIFAGGLYSGTTYVFDVSMLPMVTLAGVNLPQDTPCSSVPDAFWTLADHTAYGTYMGGAEVPGPCAYSNGEVRSSNGYAGSPGAIVRLDPDGRTLSEVPAALPTSEDPNLCPNYPPIPGQATCANPHGIQVREDLQRLVASDYAEPRDVVLNPTGLPNARIYRNTARIFDITNRDDAQLVSVSTMPEGPRSLSTPHDDANGGAMSVSRWGNMETTVTNLPENKGAFVSSMCSGVIYYTPDITSSTPVWREVFDDTTAARALNPAQPAPTGCVGGGWLQTSPEDEFLYHVVIGRNPGTFSPGDAGVPKMLYVLDIADLVAAGASTTCSVDTMAEAFSGGSEPDCPKLSSVLALPDDTTGGPHWGAIDNFRQLPSGNYTETSKVTRLATSNYFVGRTGYDGNHKVCMVNVGNAGALTLDTTFLDENKGTPCVDFNRESWPHGPFGKAKPHSELFVVPDANLL